MECVLIDENGIHWRRRHCGHNIRKFRINLLGRLFVLHGGSEWRDDLLLVQRVPIDVPEPGVALDLREAVVAQPGLRVALEKLVHDVERLRSSGEGKPTSGDMYGVFATDAVRMRWYISLRLVS